MHRRDAAADHDHVPALEFLGAAIVAGVQLTSLESFGAGHRGDERPLPGAGGVDEPAGQIRPVRRLHREPLAAIAHHRHVYRAVDRQLESFLVEPVVVGDGVGGPYGVDIGTERLGEGHPGEVVDAVDGLQGERRPAELPRPARTGRMVEHHELILRLESRSAQVVRGGQPCLPGPDDHAVELGVHAAPICIA